MAEGAAPAGKADAAGLGVRPAVREARRAGGEARASARKRTRWPGSARVRLEPRLLTGNLLTGA